MSSQNPTIGDVIATLEETVPLSLQEKWDNSGLQVGDVTPLCTGVLLAVEATEATVREAKEKGLNLLITHHPILFHPLTQIGTKTYVERTIALALRLGITIYASHTASDNKLVAMNGYLAKRLGLKKCRPLVPFLDSLFKLEVMTPPESSGSLKKALFAAGAGRQGDYQECCYTSEGQGEFTPIEGANPYCGTVGESYTTVEERLSLLVRKEDLSSVLKMLYIAHPYEEPAFDVIPMKRERDDVGSGLIGELETPLTEVEFLRRIALWEGVENVAHSAFTGKSLKRIAICSGSGGSFLSDAVAKGCDVLLTGEAKYNHYLDAAGYGTEGGILLVTIGHHESETVARQIFKDIISTRFANFVAEIATNDANPVHYFR